MAKQLEKLILRLEADSKQLRRELGLAPRLGSEALKLRGVKLET
jgi:hypothetical protein